MTVDPSSAYRRAAGHSASPVGLIVKLYEQLIRDLQRAVAALETSDIEARTNELDHALQVVAQLQGSLDMKRGGEVASNLDAFYNLVRGNVLRAQILASGEILQRQISQLVEVREAWTEVERVEATPPQPKSRPAAEDTPEFFAARTLAPEWTG